MRKGWKGLLDNWFVVLFFCGCCYVLYGTFLDDGEPLNGVVRKVETVLCSPETVMSGTYQEYINTCFEDNFPGRKLLIRIRNQLLYSLGNVSPNENVVIGKDKYLFEPGYITQELQIEPPASEEYFTELGEKLCALRKLLEKNGKELYVFISPSKAHFYKNKVPVRYELLAAEGVYGPDNHTRLVNMLADRKICFFDSVQYIEENAGRYKSPVFYKTGTHWSHVWEESAAAEFLDYMNSESRWELGRIMVEEIASEMPISPDTDLYDSLNLIVRPVEDWYATKVTKVVEGTDKPNVFLRGCSFMGQSLNMLIRQGVFEKDVHLENNYYFTDRYTSAETISGFRAYDEMNLDMLMGQTDILILEVHDRGIPDMGLGFVEYLLAHPGYVDAVY